MSKTVFLLEHIHENEFGTEQVKTIGIYSSEESAKEAIARLILLPGFSRFPNEFNIDAYSLDEDHWTSGFEGADPDWAVE